MQTGRGRFLTVMAVLIAFGGVIDLLKAISKPLPSGQTMMGLNMPPTGIVALGERHSGSGSGFLGLLLAGILFLYAMGIWQMKHYALSMAWLYAAYVILNVALFIVRNHLPSAPGAIVFAVVYLVGAVAVTLGTAIALTHRSADLR